VLGASSLVVALLECREEDALCGLGPAVVARLLMEGIVDASQAFDGLSLLPSKIRLVPLVGVQPVIVFRWAVGCLLGLVGSPLFECVVTRS
jgi:hypothetical protein